MINFKKIVQDSREEINERWFYVFSIITLSDFISNICYWLVTTSIFTASILFISLYIWAVNSIVLFLMYIIIPTFWFLFLLSLILYIISSNGFISEKGILAFWILNQKQFIIKLIKFSYTFQVTFRKLEEIRHRLHRDRFSREDNPLLWISIFWCFVTLMWWAYYLDRYFFPILQESDIFRNMLYILFPITIYVWIWWAFNKLINYFHPLYAFWNLWEKIQKLTPEIENKSDEIQENFKKDMNFSVLSSWFDSLSSIFSQIVTLVIRLEKVEKRANKWNLFDSEKYINSLRYDIVEPLNSLKLFLESQRKKLLESQKELSRIRVGWPSELSSQSDLTSKRSESLIAGLGENIGKLDAMIRKIG